jgi:nitroreductase
MATLPLSPDELLTTTRTVRRRLDLNRPVPMSVIRECLEIGLQAPTGSNRQGWHWVVVDDAEIRRRIGDVYREVTEGYLASGASAARLFTDDPQRGPVQRRIGDSVAWLAQHMGEVPVLVIPDYGGLCYPPRGTTCWPPEHVASARRGPPCIFNANPRLPHCSNCQPAFTRAC